jgi:hypothetical protein
MPRPHTEIDYTRMARRKKLEWLGPIPQNTLHLTRWRCKEHGHVFEASYRAVYEGKGCLVCNRKRRKTEDEYAQVGEYNLLKYVGPVDPRTPLNVHRKALWKTKEGRIVRYSYQDLASRRHPPGQRGYTKEGQEN